MQSKIKLALLYGGNSGEHEISLISAASVLANLSPVHYEVIPVGMDKEGKIFINDYETLSYYTKSLPVKLDNSKPLNGLLIDGKFALDVDVVFPMVHGPLYEDGCLQGLLELSNIAYVGSGVAASSICMDKDLSRKIACIDEIKSARYFLVHSDLKSKDIESFCQNVIKQLGLPLFVKPCSMGSSVGIHKTHNLKDLITAVHDAFAYDEEVLIEEFILGREIELAVLESDNHNSPIVSTPGEICVHHEDGFYSYAAKYLDNEKTTLEIPAKLDNIIINKLQKIAADIFIRLKCKGMARIDFFVNSYNEIYFNEVNTLPGFTSISMYPKLLQYSGVSYTKILDKLIALAILHRKNKNNLVRHYK